MSTDLTLCCSNTLYMYNVRTLLVHGLYCIVHHVYTLVCDIHAAESDDFVAGMEESDNEETIDREEEALNQVHNVQCVSTAAFAYCI